MIAAGHFFDFDTLTESLERVTGARIPRMPAPAWLLRSAGRVCDVLGKLTGRTLPLSGESMSIVTRWQRVEDSRAVAGLGVAWRPAEETLGDLFRWLVAVGKLPARAVPALRAEP